MNNKKVVIIGAGVSGLVAAINLEEAGFQPVIYEQSDRVGGRVQTDYIDGYQLDKGFQILLPNYPAAQKYLDLELLNLTFFSAGAMVFKKGYSGKIGNPTIDIDLLIPTLFSKFATFSDKMKIFKLTRKLKYKTFEEIFSEPSKTTLQYLKDFGFTDKVIDNFFRPFYAGIFLEDKLDTPSRMFEFTFKLFSKTKVAIPQKGIQAIPNQLANHLKNTRFHFNTKVDAVEDSFIRLENDTKVDFDFAIITTDPSDFISNMKNQKQKWKSVDNLYFRVDKRVISLPMIGLLAEKDTLVNNFNYTRKASSTDQVLSVSVVKEHNLDAEELVEKVIEDLEYYCDIKVKSLLKHYKIKHALPDIQDVNYSIPHTETKLKDKIFLSGDVLSNGSLNAAMLNGESVAKAIIEQAKGITIGVN
jgi:protoporphyrinogen oxidase